MPLRDEILHALRGLLEGDERLLVLHSSLAHLRLPAGETRQAILGAIEGLLEDGYTVAIPTYTFAFCKTGEFDVLRSRSEVGPIGEWLLEQSGATRTRHPIYSYAVAGPLAARIHACRNSTSFGADSVFALFEELDARYLMLGCGWHYCTQFHRYEEEAAVPYRFFKVFEGAAPGASATMFARRLDIEPQPRNSYVAAEEAMRKAGAIKSATLGAGTLESARSSAIAGACRALLGKDPYALLENATQVAYRLQGESGTAVAVKIALLGMSNVEPLGATLHQQLGRLLRDRGNEVHTVPFGQLPQELLNAQSPLHAFNADVSLFVDRLEDVLRVDSLDEVLRERSKLAALEVYLDAVARYLGIRRTFSGIARFAATRMSAHPGTDKLLMECNDRLAEFAGANEGVHLFDPVPPGSSGALFDARTWYLGRIPFSAAFSERLAGVLSGIVLARLGRGARAIVLDLDNTLWGGVLGEEGVGGVQIGGDFPGNCYTAFQRALRVLLERGIALAVCSKNDEDLVARAFGERREMVLGLDDFAASRINWENKWKNVLDIAETLNLGLENLLFIDDNPVEREQIMRYLPGVQVLPLPDDPALYADTLVNSPLLYAIEVTAEDKKRAASYKSRGRIESLRKQHTRPEEFYASLQMSLHLFPLDDGNAARAEQLLAKTNQFNTTTRRYTRLELGQHAANGGWVVVLGLEDRFTDLENIGVLVLKRSCADTLDIDDFLMSCRVLGRGVESGAIAWVKDQARRAGCVRVRGEIVATPRNSPVRSLFRDHGFVEGPPGTWTVEAAGGQKVPNWINVVSHVGLEPGLAKAISVGTRASARTEDSPARGDSGDVAELVRQFLRIDAGQSMTEAGLDRTPGWDSLRHIELMLHLESSLGVRFSSADIEKTKRFSDLASLIQIKRAQPQSPP